MSQTKKIRPTRYAHFEGHTDLCYTHDGRYVITCGSDGEVRIFEGLDDDDCKTHVVADCAHSVAFQDGRIFVGTDSNMVQAYTMDEGAPDGIITRFTAPATHIVVSKDGKKIACAGSDMTIKVHDTVAYKDQVISGHDAPVLSVALDPKGEYLASSSCDGSVRVWDLEKSVSVATWSILPKTNSFSSSETLCRLAWSLDGEFLYVPTQTKLNVYARSDWQLHHTLQDDNISETISLCAVSNCGQFIAGACKNGLFVIWDSKSRKTVLTEKHPKGLKLTGIAWNPSGKKELAFVDSDGQLGMIENIDVDYKPTDKANGTASDAPKAGGADFPPADVDFPPSDIDFPPAGMDMDDDDDDEEFSLAKIKQRMGFADDEEGTFLGLPKDSDLVKEHPKDDAASIITKIELPPPPPVIKMQEIQKPFQPSMTPDHLNDRYMLWNNVGIVKQYSNEEENSIDVEFHDTSVHHSLHLNNNAHHTMAALSTQVLALACEAQDEQPSKLVVQHFASFGGSKEWHVDMPAEEDILAICVGNSWIAVSTDRRNLRIFSTAGIQRDILCIPGPVVCMTGSEEQLMVVFHSGMGVSEDQQMSALVLSVNGNKHPVPLPCPVPLSPRSFLAWVGFSDEGTPVIMDSAGIVRMMHFKYGYNWTIILNTRNHVRGKSDHYFLLGVSEIQGNIRCILCKGTRFPSVLPKPHVSMINIQIPLCELETEKGGLEERTLRSGLLLNSIERLGRLGFDIDESKAEADKILKEAMIKLFALSCRTERESRAFEVCQLMPSYHTVQLAIKYAGKLHRLQLADRLGEVASAKMEEEMEKASKSYEDDDLQIYGNGMRKIRTEDDEEEDGFTQEIEATEENDVTVQENPLLEAASRRENTPRTSLINTQSMRNPFKKGGSTPASGTKSGKRGIDVIDQFRKSQKKPESSSPILRPVVKKKQATLKKKEDGPTATASGKENVCENTPEENAKPASEEGAKPAVRANPFKKLDKPTEENPKPTSTANPFKKQDNPTSTPEKKKSALQLWLADNEEMVWEKYPEASDKELLAKAALMFKDVDPETKQKYKALAAGTTQSSTATPNEAVNEDKKRKLEETTQDSPVEKKAKGSGINKLAAFAFQKDS